MSELTPTREQSLFISQTLGICAADIPALAGGSLERLQVIQACCSLMTSLVPRGTCPAAVRKPREILGRDSVLKALGEDPALILSLLDSQHAALLLA